ncbi:MAG: hypothetical protein AB7E76_05245 [Deferribacterales bacterium]|jgi:hypothetical protein
MEWEFTAEQVIDGEYELSLTDFTKKLYSKMTAATAMSIEASVSLDNVISQDLDPLEDYRIQYFICYYNFVLSLATGRSKRQFTGHTKKMPFSKAIKDIFLNKKFLIQLEQDSAETINIFMVVLKVFVSDIIESGSSTNRLPQILLMQQLNSFSSIIPNIMKNEEARSMLMPIDFDKGILGGKLLRIFK